MIRYRYVDVVSPPAPFVNISIRCPTTGRQVDGIAAQLDPGADRTIFTRAVVTALDLVEVGRFEFQGFASEIVKLPMYAATILIHDLQSVTIRAALGEHEPFVLLGRDVLNNYRVLLDGPQLALEIG